jgi:ferrous iron transport protein B
MVLGLGCDTMATFTTRILETPKERTIVTLLLALGIPCSAQLGVALGLMSAVSPGLLLVVVFTVALQLLIVGYGASKFIKGQPTPLLTEIPPLRIPKLKNIVFKTYFRVKWFMKEAVPLFVLGTFILFLLDRFKFLSWIEQITSPIITGLLQLPREATEAFIIGFLRRDYGAAGLYRLANEGLMDAIQVTVGITVMVLFVPCLANFFVIIKERGLKTALVISGFIIFYAVLVGAGLNVILRWVTI